MAKNKTIMTKPTIEIKVHCWTKRTRKEQDKALLFMYRLISDLNYKYRKYGISDEFTGLDR